jgi:hypothetical protein
MRPRRSFGADPKGRLPAAMLRALAAELADPGRFGRAKAYARDDAVTDIQVEPGTVRGVVVGSRADPYVATVRVRPLGDDDLTDAAAGLATAAQLQPERDDLAVTCTCPDGDTHGVVCKHALATLLVLADEVTIEPGLLVRWRSGQVRWPDRPGGVPSAPGRSVPTAVDVLAERLRSGGPLPAVPPLAPAPRIPVTDGFSEVLVSSRRALAG